ncbi:hypothetical protein MMC13_006186 [Lambiella insularis]|nr:hypothetical protein [Lambiella insularis]
MKEDPSRLLFTKSLRPGRVVQSKWGSIPHNSLIGKSARDIVASSTSREFRIHVPTLEEYVTMTPRLVTPVYPADANFIVSLLDLHFMPDASSSTYQPLEILEAGTGHGSLTLHLARAIHGANSLLDLPPTSVDLGGPTEALSQETSESAVDVHDGSSSGSAISDHVSEVVSTEPYLIKRKENRRAIIHTVDVSAPYSHHATTIVQGFRQGIYARNVDFYVGNVSNWIDEQFRTRTQGHVEASETPFLMHAILDLPDSHVYLPKIAPALHTDGVMIVFNPSITQILECMKLITQDGIPLWLDRVLELGAGMTGGRDWDIRTVKPRALLKAENARKEAQAAVYNSATSSEVACNGLQEDSSVLAMTRDAEQAQAMYHRKIGWEMICRPRVGERIVGGGFLGVWRKMTDRIVKTEKP